MNGLNEGNEVMKHNQVMILTGVSGSGKTTLQNKLIKEYGFIRPINFTTRQPRTEMCKREILETRKSKDEGGFKYSPYESDEVFEYVFLTEYQFITKLKNGDFAEHTYYNGNFYGVSRFFDLSRQNCIILEPVGVSSMVKYFSENNIPYKTFFLDINNKTQEYRLDVLRRESYLELEKRKKDFLYFNKFSYDKYLDGNIKLDDSSYEEEIIGTIGRELGIDINKMKYEWNKGKRFKGLNEVGVGV